jgi:hypothetical protein
VKSDRIFGTQSDVLFLFNIAEYKPVKLMPRKLAKVMFEMHSHLLSQRPVGTLNTTAALTFQILVEVTL